MADVSWGEATWVSSIVIAVIITTVGIAFFSILILTSIRSAAHVQIARWLVRAFDVVYACAASIDCGYCRNCSGISCTYTFDLDSILFYLIKVDSEIYLLRGQDFVCVIVFKSVPALWGSICLPSSGDKLCVCHNDICVRFTQRIRIV